MVIPSKIATCTIFLIIGATMFSARLFARQTVLHLYVEVVPPHVFYEGEKLTGVNFQIVERLCHEQQLTCVFHNAPWARAYDKALNEPLTGVFSTALTNDRKPLFKWVGPLEPAVSYLHKLSSNKVNLLQRKSGEVFKVATVRHSKMSEEILATGLVQENELIEFANIQECIRMLAAGRIDFAVINELARNYHARQLNLNADSFVIASPPLRQDAGNYIALNLSTPDELIEKLNQSLRQINASPWLQEVRNQYQ